MIVSKSLLGIPVSLGNARKDLTTLFRRATSAVPEKHLRGLNGVYTPVMPLRKVGRYNRWTRELVLHDPETPYVSGIHGLIGEHVYHCFLTPEERDALADATITNAKSFAGVYARAIREFRRHDEVNGELGPLLTTIMRRGQPSWEDYGVRTLQTQ